MALRGRWRPMVSTRKTPAGPTSTWSMSAASSAGKSWKMRKPERASSLSSWPTAICASWPSRSSRRRAKVCARFQPSHACASTPHSARNAASATVGAPPPATQLAKYTPSTIGSGSMAAARNEAMSHCASSMRARSDSPGLRSRLRASGERLPERWAR
jgi:hypothetical protein